MDLSKRFHFPDHVTSNPFHKLAALVHNQCTTAARLLGPLTRRLLKEVCSKVQIVDIFMKTDDKVRPLRARLVPGSTKETLHTALVVTLPKGNEKWVLDTTGGYFGYEEVLVSFKKYMAEKAIKLAASPELIRTP
ncbi:hypothetical protein PENANT_c006G04149 [Penicillium antarcticum]|uniref:Uncharacterized protein n=1 Tax=Penicillium antarcticum TaxID=416450 RepID=A0A1V6QDD5_9EURO|nr:uncharacterized protein N7508_009466 [Penicillium antarcticum]KAJ5294645.1 hypothetical protein N7508_009466 [Penicillium antarcticum]OQD87213.1 hypothetical protein PENANT_c006G04149 [Penicillium antarcticum]